MEKLEKIRVLFLCTHNQARSQMAEGILRHIGKDRYEVFSAGSEPAEQVHPMAVNALKEVGILISQQKPKNLEMYLDQEFDYVVTTCDRANETCPTFPGDPERIHWSLPDPSAFEGSVKEQQAFFNQLAMELQTRIRLFTQLPAPKKV